MVRSKDTLPSASDLEDPGCTPHLVFSATLHQLLTLTFFLLCFSTSPPAGSRLIPAKTPINFFSCRHENASVAFLQPFHPPTLRPLPSLSIQALPTLRQPALLPFYRGSPLMSRTSPKGMFETPWAQGGPQSDTRDLWRWW
jgi:hypothetical protein